MNEVIKIFQDIQNTNSLNEKINIIEKHKDNKMFLSSIKFLLDTTVITGISEKKLNKVIIKSVCPNKLLSTWDECMEYLQFHNTGTDKDVILVQEFIKSQPSEHKEFYDQMVTKSLRLGCDAKTVNKVIPNLIPTFNVMLGTPIEKCKLKDGEWISLSRKLNGTRCAFVGDRCKTRQGKQYIGLEHIIADLWNINLNDYFIDGELLYKNTEGLSDSEAFQKGTGIAMSNNPTKYELKLVIFDIFPLNEFWNGKSELTYKERIPKLNWLKEQIEAEDLQNIEVVPIVYTGTDHEEIWKWLEHAEKNDWEGIMINLDTPYECKRTKNLIKVKEFHSCDIRCIGVEEGSGRNKGTLGALICSYKGFNVNVGSGFSDEDRYRIWNNPDEVIGKIISVKYKEETTNKNGGISIQFPVFECVRFDKDEEGYN